MTLFTLVRALKLSNNEQIVLYSLTSQTETVIWTGDIAEIPIIYADNPILSNSVYADNNGVIHAGLLI